jgi:hypothetical protein
VQHYHHWHQQQQQQQRMAKANQLSEAGLQGTAVAVAPGCTQLRLQLRQGQQQAA